MSKAARFWLGQKVCVENSKLLRVAFVKAPWAHAVKTAGRRR